MVIKAEKFSEKRRAAFKAPLRKADAKTANGHTLEVQVARLAALVKLWDSQEWIGFATRKVTDELGVGDDTANIQESGIDGESELTHLLTELMAKNKVVPIHFQDM